MSLLSGLAAAHASSPRWIACKAKGKVGCITKQFAPMAKGVRDE